MEKDAQRIHTIRYENLINNPAHEVERLGNLLDIDPEGFSILLTSLLDGMVLQLMLEDPEVGYKRARDICVGVACRYLEFSVPNEPT